MRDAGDARDTGETRRRGDAGRPGTRGRRHAQSVAGAHSGLAPSVPQPLARRFGAPPVLNLNEGESGKGSLPSGMMSVVPGPMDPLPLLVPSGARESPPPVHPPGGLYPYDETEKM